MPSAKGQGRPIGVAVVTPYEAEHYRCWLNSSSPLKHPLSFLTKRFIAACAQITPSGRELSPISNHFMSPYVDMTKVLRYNIQVGNAIHSHQTLCVFTR